MQYFFVLVVNETGKDLNALSVPTSHIEELKKYWSTDDGNSLLQAVENIPACGTSTQICF